MENSHTMTGRYDLETKQTALVLWRIVTAVYVASVLWMFTDRVFVALEVIGARFDQVFPR